MAPVVIATWNVNSIRIRLPRLLALLARHQPDILCLQELKVVDEQFPYEELAAAGYHAQVWGQKTYNGVALLSRHQHGQPEALERGLSVGATEWHDDQARAIAATYRIGSHALRVASWYVPNGGTVGSDKYQYKLRWLAQAQAWVAHAQAAHPLLCVCGDMNVAPTDADVYDAVAWGSDVLCTPAERTAYAAAIAPLTDVVRLHQPQAGLFSWWDYRGLSFFKNLGLRIDHVVAAPALAQHCTGASIDRAERKGDQPSDHAPVLAQFTLS